MARGSTRDRPNILLILAEDMGTQMGVLGTPGLKTPHMDAIAGAGALFRSHFVTYPVCSPSKAAMYTGLYPHKHGVTENGKCLNEGIKGINHYLDDAGYACGYAGKWHVDQERGPSDLGFTGKDFIGYAFPGSKVLPSLQFGAAPLNEPN